MYMYVYIKFYNDIVIIPRIQLPCITTFWLPGGYWPVSLPLYSTYRCWRMASLTWTTAFCCTPSAGPPDSPTKSSPAGWRWALLKLLLDLFVYWTTSILKYIQEACYIIILYFFHSIYIETLMEYFFDEDSTIVLHLYDLDLLMFYILV